MHVSEERSGTGKKPPGAAAKPFSIRLTEAERRTLTERSGGRPLGAFVRDLVLAADGRAPRRSAPTPVKDYQSLARVLAALGQSRIANNLNQIAKAANIGALPVSPEIESDIAEACAAVSSMRQHLLHALGMSGEEA